MRMPAMVLATAAALVSVPAAAETVISETFESGFGIFTSQGTVAVETGQAYSNVGFTGTNAAALANHFAAFGGGNGVGQPSAGNLFSATFNTVANQVYTVSFDYQALGPVGDRSQDLFFGINNSSGSVFKTSFNPLAAQSVDTPFLNFSTSFVGDGTAYVISFLGAGSRGDNADILIDNVLVSAVPEAGTWAMMILGFGMVGGVLRRRRVPARVALA